MKQQVFSKQQSVQSVGFNCTFVGALSPPSRKSTVLQVLAKATKHICPLLHMFLMVLICGKAQNSKFTYVFLRYRLTGLPVDYQIKNISSPDVTNLLLEDLIIWTNYEIEVAAYNGAGLGAFSHKVTEWTLQGGELSYLQYYWSKTKAVMLTIFFLN